MITFIAENNNVLHFTRNAGDCYGGIRYVYIDVTGVAKKQLKSYITKHLSTAYYNAYINKDLY